MSGAYFGLAAGGMERMMVYPTLFGTLAFGGYLMGESLSDLR